MRFPGFNEEWAKCKLGDIVSMLKGKNISKNQLSIAGTPCILYGELYTTYKNEIISKIESKTNISPKGLVTSKVNDIIIPSSGETPEDIAAARCIVLNDVLIGGDINLLRPNKDNGSFLSYQLNGKRRYDIAKIAQGASIVHLYNEHLYSLVVYVPSLKEQNKISYFLSLLNQRIEVQNKIIEKIESLIKGIRNYLFKNLTKYNLEKYPFNKVLNQYSEINKYNWPQYTIGKNGIKLLTTNSTSYNVDKHSIFFENSCILGIGIDEIGISRDFKGACSPIYKTYFINPKIAENNFFFHFAKMYFNKAKRYITKKSTRRKFEFDYVAISKMFFKLPSLQKQKEISQTMNSLLLKREKEKNFLYLLQNQKAYLLSKLFI